jgi:hypothetical protein
VDAAELAARGLVGLKVSADFARLGELAELVARGEIHVPIAARPLEAAGAALAELGTRQVAGKLVLLVG